MAGQQAGTLGCKVRCKEWNRECRQAEYTLYYDMNLWRLLLQLPWKLTAYPVI